MAQVVHFSCLILCGIRNGFVNGVISACARLPVTWRVSILAGVLSRDDRCLHVLSSCVHMNRVSGLS
jgi:hypothetical protein